MTAPRAASAASAQLIAQLARDLAQATAGQGHGGKGALVAAASQATGLSRATVYRRLKEFTVQGERRRRSDAGASSVTRQEALLISHELLRSQRKGGKQLLSVQAALSALRCEGLVRCERIHPETGEVRLLSASAVERALRTYGLHPAQLLRPTPCTEMKSLHPNHVWQIDASLCVLYYLSNGQNKGQKGGRQRGGLQVLEADKFYKNKPRALERVQSERVWRYVVTDHYSGSIFVHYVLGAESALNLAESFIAAINARCVLGTPDPFHGVPFILMMDMGSANTSGLFKNLARRLGVQLMPHAPGNARATGQVEKAQDIVERGFESTLKGQAVGSLQALNLSAYCWARSFNATARHSRHGHTRLHQWLGITPEQLRIAPGVQMCRELLTHEPELRKVSPRLTVEFKGLEYDVRDVPAVSVGEKLRVTYNPYAQEAACIVYTDADGREALHTVPLVQRDEAGFRVDAPVIGQQWASARTTPLQANRQQVEQLGQPQQLGQLPAQPPASAETGRADPAGGSAAPAARPQPMQLPSELPHSEPLFGRRLAPLRQVREAKLPIPLPKKGQPLPLAAKVVAPTRAERTLTLFEASRELAEHLGAPLEPARLALLRQLCPQGLPESELPAMAERLAARPALRVIASAR